MKPKLEAAISAHKQVLRLFHFFHIKVKLNMEGFNLLAANGLVFMGKNKKHSLVQEAKN